MTQASEITAKALEPRYAEQYFHTEPGNERESILFPVTDFAVMLSDGSHHSATLPGKWRIVAAD